MIALWWPSNVSRATYDNLHQLTIAKMITKSSLLIITSNIMVKIVHLLNLIITLAEELFTSSEQHFLVLALDFHLGGRKKPMRTIYSVFIVLFLGTKFVLRLYCNLI